MKKVQMAFNLACKGISHPCVSKIARSTIEGLIFQGSWSCYGSGEVGCELYVLSCITNKEIFVGELKGDNGTNEFYNPSGESFSEGISDKSDEWFIRVFLDCFYDLFSAEAEQAELKRIKRATNNSNRKKTTKIQEYFRAKRRNNRRVASLSGR